MKDLIKKMKLMEWFKTLPFQDVTLCWTERSGGTSFAKAQMKKKIITLFPAIFEKTFESVQHTVFHELAHIKQYDDEGTSHHDSIFEQIKMNLILEFGSVEIAKAQRSHKIARALFANDSN